MQCVICDMWYAICDMQCLICNVWYAMCDMRYVICNVWHAICDMHGSMRVRRQRRFSWLWVPVQWFASCVTRGFLVAPRSNPPRFLARLTWNLIARCDLSSPHLTVRGEQRWFEAAGLGKPGDAKMDGNDSNRPWPPTSIGEFCCKFLGTQIHFPVLAPFQGRI